MKTHGDAGWSSFPTYLPIVVPRALDLLQQHNLRITFFIVGQDASLAKHQRLLRSIAEAGHEIGNHSFHHEPWLHLYSRCQIEEELALAEQAIENATGRRPNCFRGPGFSISDTVIEILIKRGYSFDASTLPTFLGPAGRAYYFLTAKLEKEEKEKRAQLFGNFQQGLRPLSIYKWRTSAGSLVEIPVTTIPMLRFPFHLSYLVYLATLSKGLALSYLRFAIVMCRLRGVCPSFLIHPLDLLGPDEAPELKFFPGMGLSAAKKIALAEEVLRTLSIHFQLVTMHQHASLTLGESRSEDIGLAMTREAPSE